MNLLDLDGPTFLGIWVIGWALVAGIALAIRALVARSHASGDELHPTEVAYLVGGISRAIEAAVTGLHHRGYLERDPLDRLRAVGTPRRDLSRVEDFVMSRLPASIRTLRDDADHLDRVLRATLEDRGLLVANRGTRSFLVRLPAIAWTAIAVAKLGIGISRERSVEILTMLLVGAAFVIWKLAAPRLTTAGKDLVRTLERRCSALELTARAAPAQVDGSEITLAYALYGWPIAPAALMTLMPSYRGALVTSQPASGCGSACGSSCGGGCGGCGS